ncbi:hypothetical protein HanXRQr2_Chr13g0611851 [Helianthus annuus]|uniref:Uncharacterized protein n=1 Tax=Helianthus annuus TaxID=4232 RepID=A0A9K3HCL4_HELAN|nr:hypothetical protein HanXRQr2_Chr13g0611851 [Helianthus annuus]
MFFLQERKSVHRERCCNRCEGDTESCSRMSFTWFDDGKLSTAKERGTDEKDGVRVFNHEKLELERRIEHILCLPMDIWIILCTLQTLDMVMPLGVTSTMLLHPTHKPNNQIESKVLIG